MGAFVSGIAIKGENQFQILDEEAAEERARTISLEQKRPVLFAYIYDGDYWGYALYINGKIRNEFATLPEYFENGEKLIHQYTADVPLLSQAFSVAADQIDRYLYHWTEVMSDEGCLAYQNDKFPYGDAWQMTDFLKALGFSYPEDTVPGQENVPFPTLREILENHLPATPGDCEIDEFPLIDMLPSAFSPDYLWKLLEENGVKEFQFADKNPQEIIAVVKKYCASVKLSEKDIVCQRLNVLAAFCSYWMCKGSGWAFLDQATYEPVVLSYEKPTDIYLLRARAAVTLPIKRNRAIRDLKRLIELDSQNVELYQAEIRKWEEIEQKWCDGLKNK